MVLKHHLAIIITHFIYIHSKFIRQERWLFLRKAWIQITCQNCFTNISKVVNHRRMYWLFSSLPILFWPKKYRHFFPGLVVFKTFAKQFWWEIWIHVFLEKIHLYVFPLDVFRKGKGDKRKVVSQNMSWNWKKSE